MLDGALAMITDDSTTADEPAWTAPWDGRTEFEVPEVNLAALKEKIEKLNRKARRLKLPEITVTIGARSIAKRQQTTLHDYDPHTRSNQTTREINVAVYTVTVTGERPQLPGGWELAARVQLLDGVSILHSVPGVALPREFHDCHNRCDHCNVSRFRNDVYVVRRPKATREDRKPANNDFAYMVVGSTCIADFLGGKTPTQMAFFAEYLAALDCRAFESSEYYGRAGMDDMDVERYLIAAASMIRRVGWLPKSSPQVKYEGKLATASWARDCYYRSLYDAAEDGEREELSLSSTRHYGRIANRHANPPSAEDEAEGRAAMEWAQNIPEDATSDYLINCRKVAELSYAPWNLAGIAASIVATYQREQGRLAAAAKRVKVEPQFVGTVGKREIFTNLTVERIFDTDGQYGRTHIHKFRDPQGNVLTWFASAERLREGTSYDLKASVKRHAEGKYGKETHLSRCTVVKTYPVA